MMSVTAASHLGTSEQEGTAEQEGRHEPSLGCCSPSMHEVCGGYDAGVSVCYHIISLLVCRLQHCRATAGAVQVLREPAGPAVLP